MSRGAGVRTLTIKPGSIVPAFDAEGRLLRFSCIVIGDRGAEEEVSIDMRKANTWAADIVRGDMTCIGRREASK